MISCAEFCLCGVEPLTVTTLLREEEVDWALLALEAYEDFVKETNAGIEAKSKDFINKKKVEPLTYDLCIAQDHAPRNHYIRWIQEGLKGGFL